MAEQLYRTTFTPVGKLRFNAKHDDAIPPDDYVRIVSKLVGQELDRKIRFTNGEIAVAIGITNLMASAVGTISPETMAKILADVFGGKKPENNEVDLSEGAIELLAIHPMLSAAMNCILEKMEFDSRSAFVEKLAAVFIDPVLGKKLGLPVGHMIEQAPYPGAKLIAVTEISVLCKMGKVPAEVAAILAHKVVEGKGTKFIAFNFDDLGDHEVGVTTAVLDFEE